LSADKAIEESSLSLWREQCLIYSLFEGKKSNSTGKIQSVQWISISVALVLAGIGGGYIAQKWDYKIAFLALIPIYLAVAVVAHFYREEPKAEKNYSTLFSDLKKIFADKRILIVGLFIFLYKYSPSFGTPLFFIQRDTFKWGKIWIGALSSISTLFGIAGSLALLMFVYGGFMWVTSAGRADA